MDIDLTERAWESGVRKARAGFTADPRLEKAVVPARLRVDLRALYAETCEIQGVWARWYNGTHCASDLDTLIYSASKMRAVLATIPVYADFDPTDPTDAE